MDDFDRSRIEYQAHGEALRLVADGLARYKARDLTGAIEAYRRALAADPDCQQAQERLGYAIQEQEDIWGEIKRSRQLLLTSPNDVKARFRLAQRLETLSQWEEATAEFTSVIRIDALGQWGRSAQKTISKMLQKHSVQMSA